MCVIDKRRAAPRYDAYTGAFFWRVDRGQRFRAGQEAGTLHSSGYIIIGFEGKYYKAHRLAWLFTYGEWPERDLDHINHKTSDNRIVNLRECTSSQNQANRSSNRNNSSGYRGVTFHKKLGKYQAAIRVNRKPVHLGTFITAVDAAAAYETAARSYFGDFRASLNPSKVDA
jgi:hypothetical protein